MVKGPHGDLSTEEVVANRLLAVSAGFTNLANAIGGAVQAPACHPAEFAWLQADSAKRLTTATDDLLRYAEPSMRSSTRRVRRTTELDGRVLGVGRTVKFSRRR